MNPSEGLKRLATVVRWLGSAAGTVLAVVAFRAPEGEGAGMLLVALICAAGSWAVAWALDGFAGPKT